MPLLSARSASAARLRFWGSSSTPNFANRTRRFALTAPTVRKSSSAISWFEAGVAANERPAPSGRQSASSTFRWVSPSAGGSVAGRADRQLVDRRLLDLLGIAEQEAGVADANQVAVVEAAAAGQALAVDVGAVAGEAVVGDDPGTADPVELGVQARDRLVAGDPDVGVLLAPDRDPLAGASIVSYLRAVAVAMDDERLAFALELDLALELADGLVGGR